MDHTSSPPAEATVRASVERVERVVIGRITGGKHRKRLATVAGAFIAGIALFAGGVLVGGATLAPTNDANALSIACFSSSSATVPASTVVWQQPVSADVASQYRAARTDPAGVCGQQSMMGAEQDAVDSVLPSLVKLAARCAVVTVGGAHTWYVESQGSATDPAGWGILSGTPSTGVPTDCVHVPATMHLPPATPTASCAVDANTARVYPLSNSTAAALCASHGLHTWP